MTDEATKRIEEEKKKKSGVLDLSHCGLNEIPAEVADLSWIKVLILSNVVDYDGIKKYVDINLHEELNRIQSFGSWVRPNKIHNIPNIFNNLSLMAFCCSGDEQFGHFEITVIENIEPLSTSLTYLDLNHCKLNQIKNLDIFENLKFLNLTYNQIKEINNLDNLENLDTLFLDGNQITDITNLDSLKKLIYLGLSDNKISKISGLTNLINLKFLNLRHNRKIEKIENLENNTKINHLVLNSCNIEKLDNIEHLSNLEYFEIHSNQIKSLEGIENLYNLKSIDVYSNQIDQLNYIENLQKLEFINLRANNIKDIKDLHILSKIFSRNKSSKIKKLRIDILDNPILKEYKLDYNGNYDYFISILNELNKLKEQKYEIFLPIKILILGNHQSGKSSLAYYLKYKKLPSKTSTTHILKIETIKDDDDRPLAILYDFGGQDYYHGIYKAFITSSSLHLIVFDGQIFNAINKKDVSGVPNNYFNLKYWIGINNYQASAFGMNNDPFFIIETHADINPKLNPPGDISYDTYFKGYFNLSIPTINIEKQISNRALHYIDRNRFYNHFHHYINNSIQKVKKTQSELDLLKFIHEHSSEEFKFITLEEFIKKYKYKSEIQFLKDELGRLHRSGLILYYGDITSENIDSNTLEGKIWPQPDAFVKYIHDKILNKKVFFKKHQGEIKYSIFLRFGFDVDILTILEKQKVIFLHKPKEDTESWSYIIPNFLSLTNSDDPSFQLMSFGTTVPSFILKFTNFLPFGLINQFICFYGKEPEIKKFWRDRIIFTLNRELRVIIHLDFETLEIKVNFQCLPDKLYDGDKIKEFLFYSILSLYWGKESILTFTELINNYNFKYKEPGETIILDHELYSKIYNWVNIKKEKFCPPDLYISLNGERYVKYVQLLNNIKNEIQSYGLINKEIDFTNSIDIPSAPFNPFVVTKTKRIKKIFVSYSHKDVIHRNTLTNYLSTLRYDNIIDDWNDTMITGGQDWNEKIQSQIKAADIVILLVTQDLITSTYIQYMEIRKALERSKMVIPILISDCDWGNWKIYPDNFKFEELYKGEFKMANYQFFIPFDHVLKSGNSETMVRRLIPIAEWEHPEKAWTAIAKELRMILENME